MNIKILTPESVVFEGEVKSILLPGKNGEFQILKDHAAIVSSLEGGEIKICTDRIPDKYEKFFTKEREHNNLYSLPLNSGVIEFSNNKGIVLCE